MTKVGKGTNVTKVTARTNGRELQGPSSSLDSVTFVTSGTAVQPSGAPQLEQAASPGS